jgi:hypothetical protein
VANLFDRLRESEVKSPPPICCQFKWGNEVFCSQLFYQITFPSPSNYLLTLDPSPLSGQCFATESSKPSGCIELDASALQGCRSSLTEAANLVSSA